MAWSCARHRKDQPHVVSLNGFISRLYQNLVHGHVWRLRDSVQHGATDILWLEDLTLCCRVFSGGIRTTLETAQQQIRTQLAPRDLTGRSSVQLHRLFIHITGSIRVLD